MSWPLVLLVSAGTFAFKAAGLLALSDRQISQPTLRFVGLLPPALFMALIVVQSVSGESGAVVLDSRLAGVLVAAILVGRRAPFLVVISASVVATALLRAVT